ncbi:DUF4292 domain-containing protein [Pseudoxanthomonas sp. SGD-10]|nr:DUF4292 domain-containing protein [Pseudoxanthomonas sp. SGD-10]
MRKNILNRLFFLSIILVVLAGCQSKKKISREKQVNDAVLEGRVKAKDILAVQTQYETFSSKAKASLSLDGKDNDVTLNIRNEKGRRLWISVTYIAGIEVARLLITPDSLKMLNRISSEYISKPFSFIQQYTGKGVDFNVLEAILLGNSIPSSLKDSQISNVAGETLVQGELEGLRYRTTYSPVLKPKSILLASLSQQQELKIDYAEYSLVQNRALPQKLSISSGATGKSAKLSLEYQNPQFDLTQEYPFTVPKRFTIIE